MRSSCSSFKYCSLVACSASICVIRSSCCIFAYFWYSSNAALAEDADVDAVEDEVAVVDDDPVVDDAFFLHLGLVLFV